MTNYEYIKQLGSVDELVNLFFDKDRLDFNICVLCSHNNNCNDNCQGGLTEWLKQERDDG